MKGAHTPAGAVADDSATESVTSTTCGHVGGPEGTVLPDACQTDKDKPCVISLTHGIFTLTHTRTRTRTHTQKWRTDSGCRRKGPHGTNFRLSDE